MNKKKVDSMKEMKEMIETLAEIVALLEFRNQRVEEKGKHLSQQMKDQHKNAIISFLAAKNEYERKFNRQM